MRESNLTLLCQPAMNLILNPKNPQKTAMPFGNYPRVGMERSCRRICGSPIPKGLCNKAQGCDERATLGVGPNGVQPQRGCGRAELSLPQTATLSGLLPIPERFPR